MLQVVDTKCPRIQLHSEIRTKWVGNKWFIVLLVVFQDIINNKGLKKNEYKNYYTAIIEIYYYQMKRLSFVNKC
jgi:hypothetical protein